MTTTVAAKSHQGGRQAASHGFTRLRDCAARGRVKRVILDSRQGFANPLFSDLAELPVSVCFHRENKDIRYVETSAFWAVLLEMLPETDFSWASHKTSAVD